MAHRFTFPVRVLLTQITALEAALSTCLVEATPRAVHRLRTHTRRLEAQLLLLDRLPASPPAYPGAAAALRRQLRRLRRAAGAVRDLDVHHAQLAALHSAAPPACANARQDETMTGSTGAWRQDRAAGVGLLPAELSGAGAAPELWAGGQRLDRRLCRKRAKAAAKLERLLQKHQGPTAAAAGAMHDTWRGAGHRRLPVEELLAEVEQIVHRDALLGGADPRVFSEKQLHDLRKSAKAGRYLAETLPANPQARAAAERLEALQQAGGRWHDALEMTRAARHTLGRHHPLSEAFAAERRRHLRDYRDALRRLAPLAAQQTTGRVQ